MLLIDIILAFALATAFVAILAGMSLSARTIYENADNRQNLLSTSTDYSVSTSSLGNLSDYAGTPLCSNDFIHHDVVGSFNWDHVKDGTTLDMGKLKITPMSLPMNRNIPFTDLQVRNGIAYISGDSATASDPDLFVFDFNNRLQPSLLSSIDTGPGISAISLSQNRIYASTFSTTGQLQIIRLDNPNSAGGPTSLVLETKYKLPLPLASTTPTIGSSIFFNKKIIYLGTNKWDGDELSIIDVNNPTSPLKLGGFETGSKIGKIMVQGTTVYLADADQYQLRTLNISNIYSPILNGTFSPSGWSRQEGSALFLSSSSLLFGRTAGGYDITTDHELFVFGTTSLLGQISSSSNRSVNIPGGVYGIIQDKFHTYITTKQFGKEFQIYDNRLSASTSLFLLLPGMPNIMTCDGNRIYVLSSSAPVMFEISYE